MSSAHTACAEQGVWDVPVAKPGQWQVFFSGPKNFLTCQMERCLLENKTSYFILLLFQLVKPEIDLLVFL